MKRPRISTNLAISADGKISSPAHAPSGWTSPGDKRRFLALRENADAILAGRGTLDNDRMTMTGPKNPLRCIVSRSGKLDPGHPIFSTPGGAIHLLVTGGPPPPVPAGVTVHTGNLPDFLLELAANHHVKNLHCEGGGELIRELADLDLVDDFHATLAGHTLFGGQEAPTATGTARDFLPATRHFRISHFEAHPESGECFVSYTRDRKT
ncbi:RibD family protein [Luteolibacter sp. SL250]|uniref:RibD family protein n=1 Tax=Luteolibacter sp. SL250 TaxID=2995170 RepID=UPI00226FA10A|nr:RibD family protein [Luteolibacter sp. SL250]WAC21630.1 RibD family protein [Luteolibacter sp. SL250]